MNTLIDVDKTITYKNTNELVENIAINWIYKYYAENAEIFILKTAFETSYYVYKTQNLE